MRGRQRLISALLAVISLFPLLTGCAAKRNASADAVPAEPEAALYAVQVGKGDALIVRSAGKTYLIDAGKTCRWGRVRTALDMLGVTRLDAVFLTHTDKDHAGGLMPLALSGIGVGTWYAPAYYCEPKKEKNHPAVRAAAVRAEEVTFLEAGDTPEGIFTVLAPLSRNEKDEDENSLVMRVELGGVSVLLTGDMEHKEEKELVNSGTELSCTVLKVPNHGDSDACSEAFLDSTRPKLALISTDPDEKPGTPDEWLLSSLAEAGVTVYRTDLCPGLITVACEGGEAKVSERALPGAADISGVTLSVTDAETEKITLVNSGGTDADLTGCYLVSLRGEDVFLFPAGTRLRPGETLTVGTMSTEEDTELVWEEKKVFSAKKEDGVTLYDACAAPVYTYRIGA